MKIYENYCMKNSSNMKIGGTATKFIEIEKKEDLLKLLNSGEKIVILGNGTNTLINDKNLKSIFVSMKKLDSIEELGNDRVKVGAGLDFNKFIEYMEKMNYAGLENLAGIPGTVGGLVYMNGGAYGTEIFECIESVEVIDENNVIRNIPKEKISFKYRKTEIKEKKWIVLSIVFKFIKGFDSIKVNELKTKREGNHPLDLPNLGSTFKNPEGHFAAKLILDAGMQGFRIGDAQVSMKHPNFIVNHGNASFEDIITLIKSVKEKVKETSGIDLEEEIIIVEE
jgi:UDP-N-acetylmuramate dehydrogenase